MKRSGSLGSIHYDERLIEDFWKELAEYSNASEGHFEVTHGASKTVFETPEELRNSTSIPDRVTKFTLKLESEEGTILITSNGSSHRYRVTGDEDWVRRISDRLREFSREQGNRLRNILTNRVILYLQTLLLGAGIAAFWNKVNGLIISFYSVQLSQNLRYAFWGLVIAIILLEVAKRVYPPVEFRRRGNSPRERKAAFALTVVGSVASVAQAAFRFL